MIRNLLLTTGIVLFASFMAFAQPGTLKGKLLDGKSKEPVPFANIVLENGGTQVGGTSSDFDGNYTIKPIPPGTYDLKATSVGFQPVMIQGIVIKAGKIEFMDVNMTSSDVVLDEFVVVDYKVPLIDKDKTQNDVTVTSEEIAKMPNRNANSIATTVGGVFSQDGERGSVRGARSEETVTYIDGVRVIGSTSLPASALEQVSVMLGGTPAMYGDVTGGVISITTKGPSREFNGGLELQTSQFLDPYGYNSAEFNLTGPLFKGKEESSTALLGFFLAGNVIYNQYGTRAAGGFNKATDDYQAYLHETPVRPAGVGFGIYQNAEFTTANQIENVDAIPNTDNLSANVSLKLDVKTSDNTNLTFGGTFNYGTYNNFDYRGAMFNWDNNSLTTDYTWRAYGKFTQRFETDPESTSKLKNFFYSIQVDYSQRHAKNESAKFKDDLFKYGYLGKYETFKSTSFETAYDSITNTPNVQHLNNWDNDTMVGFTPFSENMALANHTLQYYDFFPQTFFHFSLDQIQLGNGLLNGQTPDRIYGLWTAPGIVSNGFSEFDQTQLGVNVNAALDIGSHEVKFGFQYEQQSQRGYAYAPTGLWTLMRGLTNFHIQELDVDNPYLVYTDGIYSENETPSGQFLDTVLYYRKYDGGSQNTFDRNLRQKLGLDPAGVDYIDVDSYDVEAQTINIYDRDGNMKTISVGGDLFDIDMFSADELYNNSSAFIDGAYMTSYGYDHKGNKLTGSKSFDDFYNKTDDNGDFLRHAGAYEPIYMAGYIQDKFDFNGDLVVNIGLRVDRFDANQLTLDDPYLFFPAKKAGEISAAEFTELAGDGGKPSNIGDDYVVYVDNFANPTAITGYREADTWYNEFGAVIQDPNQLDRGTGVNPYLQNSNQSQPIVKEAFKDYEPQWSYMPRISFSFPISDEALFFAHYDILTQRPFDNIRFVPSQYLFYTATTTFNNPDLRPKKTIDYELGFTQKLTGTSSLSISAYYKEIRNLVQYSRYAGAYPKDYFTFKNIDFGTIKGLTITYDLRRTKNVRVRAAYTLQFADGTGSDPNTAAALVNSGLPNLRSVNPLGWDRRHAINLVLDYRFKGGKEYDGPVINREKSGKGPLQLLANTGASITFNGGSGTPYTRSENVYAINSGSTQVLQGTYFGSRIPWSFRMDLRLDKDIYFKTKEGKDSRAYMNVYFSVNNVLNSKNITGVYPYTGNPDDDGYLSAPEWQSDIAQQLNEQSYRLLYESYVNNPFNYSSPRTIRLGLIFNF
jgi:outer membrane receptor protein involved in Fe transport